MNGDPMNDPANVGPQNPQPRSASSGARLFWWTVGVIVLIFLILWAVFYYASKEQVASVVTPVTSGGPLPSAPVQATSTYTPTEQQTILTETSTTTSPAKPLSSAQQNAILTKTSTTTHPVQPMTAAQIQAIMGK